MKGERNRIDQIETLVLRYPEPDIRRLIETISKAKNLLNHEPLLSFKLKELPTKNLVSENIDFNNLHKTIEIIQEIYTKIYEQIEVGGVGILAVKTFIKPSIIEKKDSQGNHGYFIRGLNTLPLEEILIGAERYANSKKSKRNPDKGKTIITLDFNKGIHRQSNGKIINDFYKIKGKRKEIVWTLWENKSRGLSNTQLSPNDEKVTYPVSKEIKAINGLFQKSLGVIYPLIINSPTAGGYKLNTSIYEFKEGGVD